MFGELRSYCYLYIKVSVISTVFFSSVGMVL